MKFKEKESERRFQLSLSLEESKMLHLILGSMSGEDARVMLRAVYGKEEGEKLAEGLGDFLYELYETIDARFQEDETE